MKNKDIFNLANAGVLMISANELDSAHAYKVLKFKKAVKKAYESLIESEKELLVEVGIEDGMAFDKERAELQKSGENPEKLAEMDKQLNRFLELRANLFNEDAVVGEIKAIPYDEFHKLQVENKGLQQKPLNVYEDLLEGVLWAEEEE